MKLLHTSDLHLGKRVYEYSMLEDQEYILKRIINIVDEEKPDGVIIAGDVYDKSVPSAEAVQLFDDFLVQLARRRTEVFVISGNHDSPERIAFGGRLMNGSGIHMSPVYNGDVMPISLGDEYGQVNIFMLPFIKPAQVRRFFEEEIVSYTDAVRAAIGGMKINAGERNVLITHQFVTGAARSESEEISVGGTDNVDGSVFAPFDYVALGHIHGAQNPRKNIRYCGTPLKYSISEINHKKSVTIVDLKGKGDVTVSTVPLVPLRDLAEINGKYDEIMERSFYEKMSLDDFYHITLTDDEDIPGVIHKLRTVYKNIIQLDYDNNRTRKFSMVTSVKQTDKRTPMEMFSSLYEEQNGMPMTEEQRKYVSSLIEKIWGEEI